MLCRILKKDLKRKKTMNIILFAFILLATMFVSSGLSNVEMCIRDRIKGVDSTVRETNVELGKDAKLYVTERLMTDGEQKAESNIEVRCV